MRILFTAVPAPGHVLPLLPLADAAREAGHEVALLSGGGAAEIVPGLQVFEVGPSVDEALAETGRRLGGDDGTTPGPGAVELFGGVRLDGLGERVVGVAREFAPDLVIHEVMDVVGPLVAGALGVPLAAHRISGPLPPEITADIAERAGIEYASLGVVRPAPVAVVDPFPEVLLDEAELERTPERIAVRPQPHRHGRHGTAEELPELPGPVALVTLGTSVREPEAMAALVTSIAAAGVSVLATTDAVDVPAELRDRVRAIGFVPLARLLPVVDVVVSAGGSGTLLAALAAGRPQVIRPFLADQPWNAERLVRRGLGVAVDDPVTAGAAVRKVLDEDGYRRAATAAAAELAQLDDADQVLKQVLTRAAVG